MGKGKRKRLNKQRRAVSMKKEQTQSPTKNMIHLRDYSLLFFSALFVFLIYSNSLKAPFIFDDIRNIQKNPHIRLSSLSKESISRAGLEGLSSNRPVAKLSFALNYFFHQYDVKGYHLINIFIHIMTGILLFFVTKTTLNLPSLQWRSSYQWVPLITALIWLIHPLHVDTAKNV